MVQTRSHMSGRRAFVTSAVDRDTESAVDRFNTAFNTHDVKAIMALMTDDCVFESTGPAPDGERYEGQEAVAAVWDDLFRESPTARFDAEEIITVGDRCVVRWRYSFDGGHIRGVDVLRVRDGKVAEKFAYVKG
jgi:ketosteroid isomerase-like protein